jgi:zinc protease
MSTEGRDRKIAQLDCGLVVIAQRIGIPNVASTQCWVKTGSIYDRESGGAGLSHFLEHMLACGSTSIRTAAESRAVLGKLGAQSNAFTTHDTVHYYIDTTATDAPVAIDLLSDWMQHALLTPEEFRAERAVIQNEFATGRDEPGRVLSMLTLRARYGHHPARYPVIGEIDAFLALTLDRVRWSYETMYAPNNMAFVIAGDVDPEQIIAQVSKQWADVRPRSVPDLALPLPPRFDAPKLVRGYGAEERPRLRMVWPGARLGADGDHALDVLARIVGQGALSRLATTVRDQQRLVTSVEAHHLSFPWGEGSFTVDAVPTSVPLDDVAAAIQAQIERIRKDAVTTDELTRAKRRLVSAAFFVAQTVRAAAARIGRDFIQTGDPDALERYAAGIHEVSIDSVQDVVARFLAHDRLLTIHLLGKREHEAGGEPGQCAAPAPGDSSRPLATERVGFDNAPLVQNMRAVAPTPMKRVAVTAAPARRETLPNGLRVVVERDARLPIVAMEWRRVGGLLADQPGREGIANAIAVMMTRGAGIRSAGDISRSVEELGASLHSGCNHSTSFVATECLAGDWRAVLGLLSDVIERPRFPELEWANIKPRIMTAIAVHNETWHRHLLAALRQAYFDGGHPWSQIDLGRPEVIQDLDRDDLERFHVEHLAASDSVLAIVGDVAVDDVLDEVAREFGRLPSCPIIPLAAPGGAGVQPKRVRITTNKPVAAAQLAYGPGLTRRCPEYAALLVMNKILDRFPGGWLEEELRGRGLAYVVGVGMMAGAAPGYWSLMFSCQPSSAEEAMTRALGTVDRIRTEWVDEAILERAKTSALLSEALGLQSNAQRAKGFALDELMGCGFDDMRRLRDAIRTVDAQAVRDAAVRYLGTLVSVELG